MEKALLTLDQATTCTGWALWLNGELSDFGHLTPQGDYLERIVQLRAWVLFNIEHHNKNIKIVIEDIQLQTNPGDNKSQNVLIYKKLAHAQGVLLELLTALKIEYEIMSSSTWKSRCGIKGTVRSEQKKNAQKFVTEIYKIKTTQDEADAICIGHAVLYPTPQELNWD